LSRNHRIDNEGKTRVIWVSFIEPAVRVSRVLKQLPRIKIFIKE
jgi:hypothetical protein